MTQDGDNVIIRTADDDIIPVLRHHECNFIQEQQRSEGYPVLERKDIA